MTFDDQVEYERMRNVCYNILLNCNSDSVHTIIVTPTGINKKKKGEILETNVLNDRQLLKFSYSV